MNENAIHELRKMVENGELKEAITLHGSNLVGGGRLNENAIHGVPKKIENG